MHVWDWVNGTGKEVTILFLLGDEKIKWRKKLAPGEKKLCLYDVF